MHTLNNIHLAHYSNDLLNIVSKDIADQAKHLLPDLRKVTVFLPNQLSQSLLQSAILKEVNKRGFEAVLPPTLTTLKKWVRSKHETNKPLLSQYARELILVDAIKQQPDLFSSANPWGIADELLSLFDSMLLNGVQPIDFKNHYHGDSKDISHALLHESDLVKVLWEAWLSQITDEDYLDSTQAYADALQNTNATNQGFFYCVGVDQLSKLECIFLNKIDQQSKLLFYSYAGGTAYTSRADHWLTKYIDDDSKPFFHEDEKITPYSELLDEVFVINDRNIKQRAETFAIAHNKNPLTQHLSTYKTNKFEQHTKAIDVQIRIWINENKNNIGVVTTDRKLVRRLRAILEHANIAVSDAAGWALATTSAAVVIEWWLQIAEERYPAKQLLALANSPFFPVTDVALHEQAVNFFEKEIVLAFNLHSGLNHYRNAIEKVQARNTTIDAVIFDYLSDLLDSFEASSQLLSKLHGHKSYPLHRFITELLNSLKPIGLYTTLNNDDAGEQIIDLFEDQIAHFKLVDNSMTWSESRRFMSRIFDQQNYKPPISQLVNKANVTFCSLEQSRLQQYDALVIASVDKNNFPGSTNNYVFFNEQVRSELKIPTWRDDHARHLHQFRCLLDSSDRILITVQTEKNGEMTTPSPWLEAIETFYFMAYQKDLSDIRLTALVDLESTSVLQISEIPLPAQSTQPGPVLIPELKPDSISISQYQSLVDCPYQYFALSCLKLSQTDELTEELGKADFGSLVHKCIHAFFSNLPTLPGPFENKVTTHNRKEAEDMLATISQIIFSQLSNTDADTDFNNQLWLQRWLNLVPKFITWEINRQSNYTPQSHEISKQYNVNDSSQAHGRLDRVDRSIEGFSIIDYKTGSTPTKKSIVAGEQVQLPMYAILNESNTSETTKQVEFLEIGTTGNLVKSAAVIKDDELDELKSEHLARLQTFFISLNQDTPFTALASDDICERCGADGICRKSAWKN